MRGSLLLSCAALLLWACTEPDPAPLYVDTAFQVRCGDCTPRAPDNSPHDVAVLDGEMELSVSCSSSKTGDARLLDFTLEHVDPELSSNSYKLEFVRVRLGKNPGGDCLVSVKEGSNTYEGRCTNDDPSKDKPCQIELEADHGIVTGSFVCEKIGNRAGGDNTRNVVKPGTSDPVEIEIHGCIGL